MNNNPTPLTAQLNYVIDSPNIARIIPKKGKVCMHVLFILLFLFFPFINRMQTQIALNLKMLKKHFFCRNLSSFFFLEF
jgi:hypothetical protein